MVVCEICISPIFLNTSVAIYRPQFVVVHSISISIYILSQIPLDSFLPAAQHHLQRIHDCQIPKIFSPRPSIFLYSALHHFIKGCLISIRDEKDQHVEPFFNIFVVFLYGYEITL